jgi:hypothetical protein
MQLWVDTYMGRKKWLENIDKQQTILRERSCVFVTESITEGYFSGLRKINCLSPYGEPTAPYRQRLFTLFDAISQKHF